MKKATRKKRLPSRTLRTMNGKAPESSLLHSDAVKARALVAFKDTGTVTHACDAAGVARRTWYDWLETDKEFALAAFEAGEGVTDELEKEAVKRAKEGSDGLLVFLLKARRPEQYRETHKIEVVSPTVKENLRQTIAIINEELETKDAERILERLDKVWSDAA